MFLSISRFFFVPRGSKSL